MVAMDGQQQQIEPVEEVRPVSGPEISAQGSSSPPARVAEAAPLTYPEQPTGRVMDFMV